MKGILALLLAKATLHFYDSEVIGQGLTKQNIRFLFEERDRIQGVYVNEPMLVLDLNEDDITGQRQQVSSAMIHDMPKILALGLLLLELETKTSMEMYREDQDLCPQGEMCINTDYRIAERLLDPSHPNYIIPEMGPLSPFRTVLPTCVRAGEMSRKLGETITMGQNANPPLEESEALRSVIYSEIVLPLEEWVSNYDKPNTVNVLLKSTQRRRSFAQQTSKTPQLESRHGNDAIPTYHNLSNENRIRQLSREWFDNYSQLLEILQPQGAETSNRHRPVRVCILDTGIKPVDYEVYQDYGTITQYKDFADTETPDSPCDKTGHGTAAVALLVKTCPNVNLYLARVIRANKATRADVGNVVKVTMPI
ncbi:hypothetical protein NW766_004390 [Fusarium irregulare]|uniref:DUF7580 domain-containing protein n=1 Tax=Fusarium irregulare TaxID=2494466 RepID=A0A9W8PS68_9HYPO|nr:hypothetical protein NW766_004390 [Fusarium irregulare]